MNEIIVGEASNVLSRLRENSVNLTITSPPYDNLRSYKGFTFEYEPIIAQLHRVTKPGGIVVWVVGDSTIDGSETGTSFRHALSFMDNGFNLHDTMIFKKINPIPQIYRKRYTNEFEYMFVFSKGKVITHNAIKIPSLHAGLELGSTTYKNYSKREQSRKKLANPVKSTKIKGNVWEYVVGKKAEDQEAKAHPAPFPCQLARDHILSWSNPGDVVLDPMCGSGTVCREAMATDRKYIGIDISSEYVELTKTRLANFSRLKRLNPTLFEL